MEEIAAIEHSFVKVFVENPEFDIQWTMYHLNITVFFSQVPYEQLCKSIR